MRTSRTSTPRLLLRLRREVRTASLAMSALVLVLCALAVSGPALFDATASGEARQALETGTPIGRVLLASPEVAPDTGPSQHGRPPGWSAPVAQRYGGFADRLAAVRAHFPPLVRAGTGPARWTITVTGILLAATDPRAELHGATTKLSLKVDPEARREVDLVSGSWPQDAGYVPSGPVQIALSVASAHALGWPVGQVRAGYVLSGTWRPRDAGADYWSLNPSMVQPFVYDDGNTRPAITDTAFVSPVRWTAGMGSQSPFEVQVWYPLRLDRLGADDLGSYVSSMRRLSATASTGSVDTSFTLAAAGLPDLVSAQGRALAARSVITLAAVGPAGALLLLLLLGVRGFALRRRTTVGLLASRGASRAGLRSLLALEGLVVGVPAAALALASVWLALRVPPTRAVVVVVVVVALLPALILAAAPVRASGRRDRADKGVRRRRPWPRLAGAVIVVLAAASTYLLMSSGPGGSGGHVDLLVVAAPLLLCAAAAVVVLRLYPLPLLLVSRRLTRGRSAIGWLGVLRSLRDPTVQVAPVVTVLVAVAMAVFSVITLATIRHGADQAALTATGAQLRVDDVRVDDATYARVRQVPGVAAAARAEDVGTTEVVVAGRSVSVDLYRADLRALERVQADVPGGLRAGETAVGSRDLGYAGSAVRVGTTARSSRLTPARQVSGLTSGTDWLLVDAATRTSTPYTPDLLLVSLDPGADPHAVGRRVRQVVGDGPRLSLADDAAQVRLRDPLVRALTRFLLVVVVVVALAAVASVVLSLAMGAAARRRHLTVLRVLGVPRSPRRWYAVWEQAPPVSVALVVGGVLGAGLAAAVYAVIDLSPFTGQAQPPELVLPRGALALLLGGFCVLVALAIGAGIWWSERYGGAAVLTMDEE